MKKLFAPWRSNYTTGTAHKNDGTETEHECGFCTQLAENNDPKYFIFRRFKHTALMLNRYPYNAGHLLIITLDHTAKLPDLSKEARAELQELTSHSVTILEKTLEPAGMNVGLNLGKAAGAGMPAHLHVHVLPRWLGDTNFLPALGKTRIISFDLTQVYEKLKPHVDALPEKLF